MTEQAMIEAFEDVVLDEFTNPVLHRDSNGYVSHTVAFGYKCWQAALQWAAEGQEPVAYQYRCKSDWSNTGWSHWNECCKENADDFRKTPYLHGWTYETRALYAAPVPNADLLAEVERLRKALSFYADETRYCGPNTPLREPDEFTEDAGLEAYRLDVTRDHGSIARAALAKGE